MNSQELIQILKMPVRVKKITVKAGPFLNLEFERDDILDLQSLSLRTERVLRMQFIERRVMWDDLRKELPEPTMISLRDAAKDLDEEIHEMTKNQPPIGPALVRLLAQWRTGCVMTAKTTEDKFRDAQENNRTACHQDEFIQAKDYMPQILTELRHSAYPVIRALIDLLPEGNVTRTEALSVYYSGLEHLKRSEQDAITPEWKVSFDAATPDSI